MCEKKSETLLRNVVWLFVHRINFDKKESNKVGNLTLPLKTKITLKFIYESI
jgi:hypothetical protein